MSARTRTHRPNSASPRYSKRRGIGRDRERWPASLGTYRRADQTSAVGEDPSHHSAPTAGPAGIDPPPASTPTDTGGGR